MPEMIRLTLELYQLIHDFVRDAKVTGSNFKTYHRCWAHIAVNVVLSIIANAQKNGLVLSLIATISRTNCCYFKMEIALLFRVPDC